MASVIRFALANEAVFTVLGAVILIVFPRGCLSLAVASPASITGSAALLCQVFGAMALSLSVPLFLCIPDSTAVYEKRRIVYKTMAAADIACKWIALILIVGSANMRGDQANHETRSHHSLFASLARLRENRIYSRISHQECHWFCGRAGLALVRCFRQSRHYADCGSRCASCWQQERAVELILDRAKTRVRRWLTRG